MKQVKILCCIVSLLLTTLPVAAQGSHWGAVNPHDYQYDMTLYATITIDGETMADLTSADIAAFVGDELRGVGRVETKDGHQWIYMRIYTSQAEGETIWFKLWYEGIEYKVADTQTFASAKQVGMPGTPQVMHAFCPHTLTVVIDGTTVETSILYMGDPVSYTPLTRVGYTFEWETTPPTTMPAADLTITGAYTINSHKVTFISDGQTIWQATQNYGTTITPPSDPEKEGYTFTGWSPAVDATLPDRDVSYEAQFEPILVSEITFTDEAPQVSEDGTVQLVVEVTPADALDATVSFTSSDPEIATVSPSGLVTFIGYGTVTITATATDGSGISHQVTITRPLPFETEDVNRDGSVDTQDILSIYEFMQNYDGTSPIGIEDVNHDGSVDTQDVLSIYEYMQNH